MSTTTTPVVFAASSLGVAAGIKAAGITAKVSAVVKAEGKRSDAVLTSAVALVFGLKSGAITVPAAGRAKDYLAETYPVLGSPSQVQNLLLTGEACAVLGNTITLAGAAAVHSAVTAGAKRDDVLTLAGHGADAGASDADIVAAFGTLKDAAAGAKRDRAAAAAKTREEAAAKADAENGDAVTVKGGASREARLSSAGQILSVVKGADEWTAAERAALSTVIAHAERILHESGLTAAALEAEVA
ncbi:MAG: hypothetical protein ACOYB3_01985 [Azonexus sp.]